MLEVGPSEGFGGQLAQRVIAGCELGLLAPAAEHGEALDEAAGAVVFPDVDEALADVHAPEQIEAQQGQAALDEHAQIVELGEFDGEGEGEGCDQLELGGAGVAAGEGGHDDPHHQLLAHGGAVELLGELSGLDRRERFEIELRAQHVALGGREQLGLDRVER